MRIGSKSHLRRGDPQNASREALGAFLEASGAEKKKLGTALCRFGPKKGAKMGAKMAPQNAPRCLHEAKMLQEGSKMPLGTDLNPVWEPSGTQKQHLHIKFPCFEGAPGACQEHSARHPRAFQDILKHACFVKSVPRYSKTSRSRPPS